MGWLHVEECVSLETLTIFGSSLLWGDLWEEGGPGKSAKDIVPGYYAPH